MATAITPMAFYETVMVKGYETLVDLDTTVDVNTGMIAAGRLQTLIESRASGTRIADLMVQMGRIIDAVHSTVPEELWPEILRKIDGPVRRGIVGHHPDRTQRHRHAQRRQDPGPRRHDPGIPFSRCVRLLHRHRANRSILR